MEEYITLEFDDGTEMECEIMGVFEVDGSEYVALLPDDGSDDVYLYGFEETGEDEYELRDIEDDEEFARVDAEFSRLIDEAEAEIQE